MTKTSTEKKNFNFTLAAHQSSRGTQFFPIPCTAASPHLPRNSTPGKEYGCCTRICQGDSVAMVQGVLFCVCDKEFKGSLGTMHLWN